MTSIPRTLSWQGELPGRLRMIDQTKLPAEFLEIDCETVESVWEAIRSLRVRGAPAIGVSAAYGTIVGLQGRQYADRTVFDARLSEVTDYLATSRPTTRLISSGRSDLNENQWHRGRSLNRWRRSRNYSTETRYVDVEIRMYAAMGTALVRTCCREIRQRADSLQRPADSRPLVTGPHCQSSLKPSRQAGDLQVSLTKPGHCCREQGSLPGSASSETSPSRSSATQWPLW